MGKLIITRDTKKADVKVTLTKKTSPKLPIGFKAKKGEFGIVGANINVGTKGIKNGEDWRELGVKITKYLKTLEVKTVFMQLNYDKQDCKALLEGLHLGDYRFDKYKSQKNKSKLEEIMVDIACKDKGVDVDLHSLISNARLAAESTNITRDWVNTTPEDANSHTIEQAVRDMFANTVVKVDAYGEDNLKRFGMNGHLAVNRASRHEAKTIKLTYSPEYFKEHHVFVGKGLTYDSGGLSIKPGNYMTTMKADKAGAMTLMGMMNYIAHNGAASKITCYLGIAENMIDGSAYKPDDVLTMMNGKTVHVKNTDAEGRIVLFDNICLAQKENKDISTLHTLATLTGAAVYSFGDEVAALVGFNDKLKSRVQKAGDKAGEIYMDAAFHKYMLDGVRDSLADLSNTGTPNMGCQKAGLFLTNAVKKKNKNKYVHWDIAGPAFVDTAFGHNPSGGTGFGVRTLINFVNNRK